MTWLNFILYFLFTFHFYLECLQNTFLYESRCYTSCPERSYISSIINQRQKLIIPTDENDNEDAGREILTPPQKLQSGSLRRRAILFPQVQPQKSCAACHFSCLKCSGPNDYDCTACTPDSLLTEKSAKETYCAPINQKIPTHDIRISKSMYIFLLILGPALSILLFLIVISWLLKRNCLDNKRTTKSDYIYDRVALDSANDKVNFAQEIVDYSSETDG